MGDGSGAPHGSRPVFSSLRGIWGQRGPTLFGPGFAVIHHWNMGIPAGNGAKAEARSLPVAGGNVADPIDAAQGDGLLADIAFLPGSEAHRIGTLWIRLVS